MSELEPRLPSIFLGHGSPMEALGGTSVNTPIGGGSGNSVVFSPTTTSTK
jgi:hypothetical protein